MLKLLYTNFELCTASNGFTSKYLPKNRGTNQGCPASPLVYSYCCEIMAHLMFQDPNICGINVDGIRQLLSQFANDTAAFLKYEKLVLDSFINVLNCVEKLLGLKVSYDKTTIYSVGSLYKTNAKLLTQHNFKWSDGPVELLGIAIPCDNSVSNEGFSKIMNKIEQVCSNWEIECALSHSQLINRLVIRLPNDDNDEPHKPTQYLP